jgi:integrase
VTIVKNARTGRFEGDFRARSIGRLHLSLRTKKVGEARTRHAAVEALIKQGYTDLVDRLRAGSLRVEAVERVHQAGGAFEELRVREAVWPTLDDATADYLAAIAANPKRSARTHQFAEQTLRVAAEHFGGETFVDTLTVDAVQAYAVWLRAERKLSENTVGTYLVRLGALYRWLQQRENRRAVEGKRPALALYAPVDRELIPTFQQTRVRFLALDEAAALYAACPALYRLPVALGLYAGLRLHEILMLRPVDVDLELGLVHVQGRKLPHPWKPKGGKHRDVPVAPALRTVLERHLAAGYASAHYLLPMQPSQMQPGDGARPTRTATFGYAFAKIVRDAGMVAKARDPKGVTPHTLRHTFASWLVMEGVDLFTVSRLMGHSSTDHVERTYGHLAPEHKRRAIERLAQRMALPLDLDAPAAPVQAAS